MDKKKFELVAFAAIVLCLVFVPTKLCGPSYCIASDWEFIWAFSGAQVVDIMRLAIQVVVVAGVLIAVWRFKYKEN